uniref:Olfactory receptor 146 n=1 Tax=Aulacocentrum confusum TaxID=2767324 RepID=A0A7G8Z9G5_9HYME|nr:olfactory receptor 146 [Aulacocentrum confusum]
MYFTGVMFCCMPIVPMVLDIVSPLNESRPAVYMFQGEYFLNQEKFYYVILLHAYVSIIVAVTLLLAIDTEYATHVFHSCAIFGVLRYYCNIKQILNICNIYNIHLS